VTPAIRVTPEPANLDRARGTELSLSQAEALREGLAVGRRFYGKDATGKDVVIDIQFRLQLVLSQDVRPKP
jgi:hypothetical protein